MCECVYGRGGVSVTESVEVSVSVLREDEPADLREHYHEERHTCVS